MQCQGLLLSILGFIKPHVWLCLVATAAVKDTQLLLPVLNLSCHETLGKSLRRTRAPKDQMHEDWMSDLYVFSWAKPKVILNYGHFLLQRYLFPEAEMLHLQMQAIYHRETIFWAKSLLLMSLFLNGPSGVRVNELSWRTTIFPPAA